MDDGFVTDSLGRKINFKNTLIILTSNLGVKKFQEFGVGIGFGSNSYSNEEAKKQMLMKEMKNFFAPEFLNRIDDTIMFNTLSEEDIKKITRIELDKLVKRLTEMNYLIKYDESVVEFIGKVGYDQTYGARPMKRAIQDKIEDLISEEVLTNKIKEKTQYTLKVIDEVVTLKKGK
jgi:ATP-dependent Clp protease ATP-binding subunit ClpC